MPTFGIFKNILTPLIVMQIALVGCQKAKMRKAQPPANQQKNTTPATTPTPTSPTPHTGGIVVRPIVPAPQPQPGNGNIIQPPALPAPLPIDLDDEMKPTPGSVVVIQQPAPAPGTSPIVPINPLPSTPVQNTPSASDCKKDPSCCTIKPVPVVIRPTPAPAPIVIRPTPTPAPIVIRPTPTPAPIVIRPTPNPRPIVVNPAPAPAPVIVAPSPDITPVQCHKQKFQQPIVNNKLDVLIVFETRSRGFAGGQAIAESFVNSLIDSYRDILSDLGPASDIRIGLIPALTNKDPRQGQLAPLCTVTNCAVQPAERAVYIDTKSMDIKQLRDSLKLAIVRAAVESEDRVFPGGSAGLQALNTALTTNAFKISQQGLLREDAALHVIFASPRGDVCASLGRSDAGSQPKDAAQICQGFNTQSVVQSLAALKATRTVAVTSLVYGSEQTVSRETHGSTGARFAYAAGVGYGYIETTQALGGKIVDLSNVNALTQEFTQIRYGLLGQRQPVRNQWTLNHTPLEQGLKVSIANPVDPRDVSVQHRCYDLDNYIESCPNMKMTDVTGISGRVITVREPGLPGAVITVDYCVNVK